MKLCADNTVLVLLVLPLLVSCSPGDVNLTFMFITSFGQFGFNSSGAIPAADMALEDINGSPDVLPGYNLVYDRIRDSECHRGNSSDLFFEGIQSEPVKVAVVGCGCSVATEPVAEISHRWNISQISYSSGLLALSDRSRFKRYFRNSPTFGIVAPALHSSMDYFNWTRIALITQNEGLFRGAESSIRRELEAANITVSSRTFNTGEDPLETPDLFLTEEDYRIFLVNCYSLEARRIICEAKKRNYTSPRYVWMFYDWYPKRWWNYRDDGGCTDLEIEQFLEQAISVRRYPLVLDTNATTDAGISASEFEEEYERRAMEGQYDVIDTGVRLYDVMWVLAVALNRTMMAVESEDISGTGCEEVPGSLVPLEQFSYINEKMGCLIQWNLQRTNFSGVSERVTFNADGTRTNHIVRLRQYRYNGTNLERQLIVSLDERDNNTFTFEAGVDINHIFPGGTPSDGSPIEITHTFHIGIIVVFDILATLGIIFAIVCFFFNLIFREEKVVKLSSPKLNCFIIVGAILMYTSVYIYLLPSLFQIITHARCIVQYWLFTVGYSLIFGTVVAKMWRIYHIFHNPAPNKRAMKDVYLVVITLVITGISTFLLFLWTAIPHLRGMAVKERDDEHPFGETDEGVREEYVIWVCYQASSPTYFWQIFIYAYLVVLQIVGIVLAFQTRKVKLQGLRDSKFIASIVYISSIVLVILALVTFGLRTYINIGTGIFVAGIFILTTITLALLFVPKMVLLYKGSDEETIKTSGFATDVGATRTGLGAENDLEQKVLTLESTLREKNAALTELRNELAMMKDPKGSVTSQNNTVSVEDMSEQ